MPRIMADFEHRRHETRPGIAGRYSQSDSRMRHRRRDRSTALWVGGFFLVVAIDTLIAIYR